MSLILYLVFKSMLSNFTSPNVVVVLHKNNTSSHQIMLISNSALGEYNSFICSWILFFFLGELKKYSTCNDYFSFIMDNSLDGLKLYCPITYLRYELGIRFC